MKKFAPVYVAVFDFDGTLISKSYGSLYDVVDSNKGVTDECHKLAKEMRKYYFSILKNRLLTQKEKEKWLFDSIELYVKSKLSMFTIQKIMCDKVRLRDGVVKCFKMLKEKNIPVAIISYGVAEFIQAALEANGALELVDEIYAAKLKVDENGLVIGFDKSSAVFPGGSKGKFSRLFAYKHRVSYNNILAVGDSGGDANLGHLKINRFGIAQDESEKEKLNKFMGTAAITENFDPIAPWLLEKSSHCQNLCSYFSIFQ